MRCLDSNEPVGHQQSNRIRLILSILVLSLGLVGLLVYASCREKGVRIGNTRLEIGFDRMTSLERHWPPQGYSTDVLVTWVRPKRRIVIHVVRIHNSRAYLVQESPVPDDTPDDNPRPQFFGGK